MAMEVKQKWITSALLQEDMKQHRSSEEKQTTPDMDLLESTKAEMDEIREENGKLKSFLARIMKDYHSLQTQYFDMNCMKGREYMLTLGDQSTSPDEGEDVEKPVISLSLGLMNNQTLEEEKGDDEQQIKNQNCKDQDDQLKGYLALGLESKFEESAIRRDDHSSNTSTDQDGCVDPKDEEDVGEPCPQSSKANRTTLRKDATDDEVSLQPPAKRARVCVRIRCDAPTMNDGCQWRKYGQKVSKGNPCPRAYYRCTVAPSCPVRKQVQRCAEDLSILIISYEGTHNHPLPFAARAMASTTAAAASMLTSGASSSVSSGSAGAASSNTSSVTLSAGLHGTNYSTLSDVISASGQFSYSLNRSNVYASTSHPSITLDFTGNATPPKSSGTQFRVPPGFILNSRNLTGFNLASKPFESSAATSLTPWNNGYSNYGSLPYTNNISSNNMLTSLGLGLRQSQEVNYNIASSLPKATSSQTIPSQTQQLLTDTIAKMITANPSFQSAVAAAITSYVGGGSREVPQGAGGHSGHEMQRRDLQPSASDEDILQKISSGARASSFLTRLNSSYSTPSTDT